jgi:hypothetical protein
MVARVEFHYPNNSLRRIPTRPITDLPVSVELSRQKLCGDANLDASPLVHKACHLFSLATATFHAATAVAEAVEAANREQTMHCEPEHPYGHA